LVQKQLSQGIAIIGKEDFPAKWPELMQQMVINLISYQIKYH